VVAGIARRHADLSPSHVADAIQAGFPTFGIVEPGKVAMLAPVEG